MTADEVLFTDERQGVTVTRSMATFGGTSYPIRNITSVSLASKSQRSSGIVLAILFAVATGLLVNASAEMYCSLITGTVMLIGIVVAFIPRSYSLSIHTAGVEQQVMQTPDGDAVAATSLAIKKAIAGMPP